MDKFNLKRFTDAQADVIESVQHELTSGRNTGHWMWFIFPQMAGLGTSEIANWFGIRSRAEAKAYLGHPVLGDRLRKCTELVYRIEGASAEEIFAWPDHLKLRSCMTLFGEVAPKPSVFTHVLEKYFDAQPDEKTLELLDK